MKNRQNGYVGYFKSFGTTVLTLNRKPTKEKLNSHSEGYFVSYSETSKVYRIWISSTRCIEITRDVEFLSEFTTSGTHEDFMNNETMKSRYRILESEKGDTPKIIDKCADNYLY